MTAANLILRISVLAVVLCIPPSYAQTGPEKGTAMDGVKTIVLELRPDGTVRVLGADGRPFVPCVLCTDALAKEDPGCANRRKELLAAQESSVGPEIDFCLNETRVESLTSIGILQASSSPSCPYVSSFGSEFVLPGGQINVEAIRRVFGNAVVNWVLTAPGCA